MEQSFLGANLRPHEPSIVSIKAAISVRYERQQGDDKERSDHRSQEGSIVFAQVSKCFGDHGFDAVAASGRLTP